MRKDTPLPPERRVCPNQRRPGLWFDLGPRPWRLARLLKRLGTALAWSAAAAATHALAPLPPDGGSGPSECSDAATVKFTASPAAVTFPASSTLNWSLVAPAGCRGLQLELDGTVVTRHGSRTDQPPRSTRHVLRLLWVGSGQRAVMRTLHANVSVAYPQTMRIDASTQQPVTALLSALDPGNVNPVQIQLCNVDLDLTGRRDIPLRENLSLVAAPGCERGPRSLGPRIFVTDKRPGGVSLFLIRHDKVKLEGFRLQGPTAGQGSGEDNSETGIRIWPFESATPIARIQISNMEVSQWAGAGISVGDQPSSAAPRGRLFRENVGAVRITGNYVHHNRHDQEGYGVSVGGGAYALIERNVFDENRHAIAGGSRSGDDFSGYTVNENLVLSGGGVACSLGVCWQTHQIDMHGDKTDLGYDWCCGNAGETLLITRNTVLYTAGLAIKVRGNPVDKAVVDGNVFRHASRSEAIGQNGSGGFGDNISKPIDVRPDNVFGFTAVATGCDVVGDGLPDLLMPTGVTWWARSATTQQWRHLNTQPQTLPQLMFADADGDGRCDVLLRPQPPATVPSFYSSGGSSAWKLLGANGP